MIDDPSAVLLRDFLIKATALETQRLHPYHPFVYRFAVGAFFFLCGTTFASWAARIPTIKNTFNLNEAQLGSILFLLPLGSLAVLPIAGWTIHKFGSRITLFIVAVSYAVVLFLLARCQNVFQLSLALFFFGFFGNALNIAVNTQALQVELKLYKRSLMSSFHALWSAGAMTGAIITGIMIRNDVSIDDHYLFIASLMILIYLVMHFYLIRGEERNSGSGRMVWPSKLLWLLGVICFCCALCEGAMADWSSLFYKQVIGDGSTVNTTGYTAFALMMAIGRIVGDRLVDRFGYKNILMVDSLFIALGFLIGTNILNNYGVIIGFGLIGIGVSTVIPIVYTLSGKNPGTPASISLATVSSIGFSGFLIGPPIIGYIAHGIGLRPALMMLTLMGAVIFLLSKKMKT